MYVLLTHNCYILLFYVTKRMETSFHTNHRVHVLHTKHTVQYLYKALLVHMYEYGI